MAAGAGIRFGGRKAAALLGQRMHHDRTLRAARLDQDGDQRVEIVPVHGPEIGEAQRLEERRGRRRCAGVPGWRPRCAVIDIWLSLTTTTSGSPSPPTLLSPSKVSPPVRRAVAHHRHHVTGPLLQGSRARHAVGHRHRGAGVSGGEGIVGALGGIQERGDPIRLPQGRHARAPSGHQLVRVGLVPHVEDEPVPRRLEDAVQPHHQLHHPQRGAQMPAHPAADLDDVLAQSLAEGGQQRRGQRADLLGGVHGLHQRGGLAGAHSDAPPPSAPGRAGAREPTSRCARAPHSARSISAAARRRVSSRPTTPGNVCRPAAASAPGRLAQGGRVGGDVEQVVRHLERQPDRLAVDRGGLQRGGVPARGQHPEAAGGADQRAGLHAMQALQVGERRPRDPRRCRGPVRPPSPPRPRPARARRRARRAAPAAVSGRAR